MLILFHIFVMLIGFIMPTKENINVPRATAILTLCDETDKPFAEGTSYSTDMKMIKDLGGTYSAERKKWIGYFAIYECPYCGRHFKANKAHVKNGHTRTCGCKSHQLSGEKRKIHGLSNHPLYGAWRNMISRCNKPSHKEYKNYGARGITVCDEWVKDFKIFYAWAITKYKPGLVFDRENNDGNYEPSNCRWVITNISAENNRLIRASNNSGYRGVMFRKKKNLKKPWLARISWNYVEYKLGYYPMAREAAQAYNNFVIKHKTNHPLNKL